MADDLHDRNIEHLYFALGRTAKSATTEGRCQSLR
jgi:hypothetical protein